MRSAGASSGARDLAETTTQGSVVGMQAVLAKIRIPWLFIKLPAFTCKPINFEGSVENYCNLLYKIM